MEMRRGKQAVRGTYSEKTPRSWAGTVLKIVIGLPVLLILALIGVVVYEDCFYAGIRVEPQSPTTEAGGPLRVSGQFLSGCQLSLGARGKFVPVDCDQDPFHGTSLTIRSVPQNLAGKTVCVRATRVVPGLPFLAPILPCNISRGVVQVSPAR